MLAAYKKGHSAKSLGAEYGVDHSSIIYQVQKHKCWRGHARRYTRKLVTMRKMTKRVAKQVENVPTDVGESVNAGKSYAEYMADDRRRNGAAIRAREQLMDRLRAEKKARDKAIAQGKIPRPDPVRSFGDYAATPIW